jgi:hypothetical protein
MHTDSASSSGSDAIVAAAQSRGVPIVSARQMLTWLDGRNGSSFKSIAWSGNTLSFTIDAASAANGLRALVPTTAGARTLSAITRGGSAVTYSTATIKGVEYAVFPAVSGDYQVAYGA